MYIHTHTEKEIFIPQGPILVNNLSRRHCWAFVITGTSFRWDTLPRVIQIGSLRTDTAVDGWEGEVTEEICGADAVAGATAGCDVVGVDRTAGAGAGIFPWGGQTTEPVKSWKTIALYSCSIKMFKELMQHLAHLQHYHSNSLFVVLLCCF